MKKKVKIIGGIVLAVIVVAGAAMSAMSPLAVSAATLQAVTAKVTFTEQGSYMYNRSLAVYPLVSGEVLEVKAAEGQQVKKGDVLAVVSASDYEYQVKNLENTITGYNAQIENLYAQEKESKSALSQNREALAGQLLEIELGIKNYANTKKTLERQIELQESIVQQNANVVHATRDDYRQAKDEYDDGNGSMTQAEYNAFRAAYNAAETAWDLSRQQLEEMKTGNVTKETLEAQRDSIASQLELIDERIGKNSAYAMAQYYNALIESAKANIESMNEKLGQAVISAPIDGAITALPVKDANVVGAQGQAAVIASDPVVEVFVPIREIDSVHAGDTVELILDKRLGSETVEGTVTLVEDEAQMRVSALGVEERKVRVLIKPLEDVLKIGYGLDVKFTVVEQPDSIIVPKTAMFEKDGRDMVWVIENGTAALREVEKGVETRDGYAVTSGLSAGETVVRDANTQGLKEGKRVKAT